MKLFKKNNSGFSLMELMLVMTIIIVLVSGVAISLRGFNRRAQDKSAMIMLRLALAAADAYRAQHGSYPVGGDFSTLINGGFIQDPNTGNTPPRGWSYTYSGSSNSVTITATGAISLTLRRRFSLTKTVPVPGTLSTSPTVTITCTGPNPWGSTWY